MPEPDIQDNAAQGIRSALIGCLRSLQAEGVHALPLDEEARAVLRAWMLAAREGRSGSSRRAHHVMPPISATTPEAKPARAGKAEPLVAEPKELPASIAQAIEEAAQEAAESAGEDDEELIPFFRPGGDTPEEIWNQFERMLPQWVPMRALGTLREQAVMGDGDRRAALMFVGDAPNYYDEQAKSPFAGAAGEKLDGMLAAMGLSRASVYVTYAVPFRPALPRQTTNNRPPSSEEIRVARPVLEAQASLVQPRVIVALGVIAARSLLKVDDLPLDAFRRKEGRFSGIPIVVTHHPSYLLRTSDLAERRLVWEDMLRAMELAGLPVTAKQKAYFLPSQPPGSAH